MVSPLWNQCRTFAAVVFNTMSQIMLFFAPIVIITSNIMENVIKESNGASSKIDFKTVIEMMKLSTGANVVGLTASSIAMKYLGRKRTHQLAIAPALVAWLLVRFAGDSVPSWKAAVILASFSSGASGNLAAIVVGEYSTPKYRGVFLYLINLAAAIGGVMGIVLVFLYRNTSVAVGMLLNFLAVILTQTWPESPFWLASKRQYEKSEKAFYWLRGETVETTEEITRLIESQRELHSEPQEKTTVWQKIKKFLLKFWERSFLMPFGLMVVATILLEVSGKNIVKMNSQAMLGGDFQGLLSGLTVCSALLAVLLVRYIPRRTLLFGAGFTACVLLIVVSFFSGLLAEIGSKVTITLFSIYFILANFSCTPLPLVLMGELFPLSHKGIGSAATGIASHIIKFVVEKLTVALIDSVYVTWTFFMYSIVMFVCLLVLYFKLPETKDLTLQDIERYFVKHHRVQPVIPEERDFGIQGPEW